MKQIGTRGAVGGQVVKTTIPDTSEPCPRDKVNRVFRGPTPNLLCPLLNATDHHDRFAEVGLGMARRMIKRHKHLAFPPTVLAHIVLDDGVTALESHACHAAVQKPVWPHCSIFNAVALTPLGHCPDIDAKLSTQCRVRSF